MYSKVFFTSSGAQLIDIDSETKRILLRSRQATQRPSPEPSPTSSRRTSFASDVEEVKTDVKTVTKEREFVCA